MRKYYNKNKLIEALNHLDELASVTTSDNLDEATEQQKAYNHLFDFIDSLHICERATCNNIKAQNHDHDYCAKHL